MSRNKIHPLPQQEADVEGESGVEKGKKIAGQRVKRFYFGRVCSFSCVLRYDVLTSPCLFGFRGQKSGGLGGP